jgi:PhzF family phenazine biosynthesis protein
MNQTIYVVDAFTAKPTTGNPAGVCVMERAADEKWMQSVAAEMNHAETAFLYPKNDGYHLRWFTPKTEVPLCGHATLASAHILWSEGFQPKDKRLQFHTLSGTLSADRLEDGWIQLDFPVLERKPVEEKADVEKILGVKARKIRCYNIKLLLELESEQAVRAVRPDFAEMLNLNAKGVIVTARSTSTEYDFVSRFFAPAFGINEDPVTGSAHCALAPYWKEKLGKDTMMAYQASARGGVLRVTVKGDRVLLAGQAVTTLKGELSV